MVLTVGSATLAGDYNNDGTVNAADYVVWRDNVNLPVILPGDITPGTVDQSDYDVWRQNFAAGAGAASTAVPEPGAVAFMSMFLACMVSSTGRRRRR